MTRLLDIVVSTFLLLAGIAFFATTYGESFDVPTFGGDVGPAFAPRIFLGLWIILSIIALVQALRSSASEDTSRKINLKQLIVVILIACGTAQAVTVVGFTFATIPGFALFCWAFQYRKPVPLLVLSIAAPLIIWALFTFGFELLLPHSPWFNQI